MRWTDGGTIDDRGGREMTRRREDEVGTPVYSEFQPKILCVERNTYDSLVQVPIPCE